MIFCVYQQRVIIKHKISDLIFLMPEENFFHNLIRISNRFPTVLLNPGVEVPGCSSVVVPNFESARDLVRHLLRLGHRSLAIIKGPPGNVDAEERFRGYLKAADESALATEERVELEGDFTEASGFRAATQLLGMETLPTAIFATNDSMAVGAISAMRAAGVGVPEDIALLGFDDTSIAQFVTPALTTAQVDAFGMGERSVELLIASIQNPQQNGVVHEVMPAPLVIRQSCGATGAGGQTRLRQGAADTSFEAR